MHQSIQSLKILIWTTHVAFELLKICLLKFHPPGVLNWLIKLFVKCKISDGNFLLTNQQMI